MNLLDRIFPQLVAARQANEAAARRDAIYSKLVERELAELEVSSERPGRMNSPLLESTTTVQNLGNTWWTELSSLTLDQAWKQGFPSLELAYSINAAMVANNDAFRNLTLAVSRALYDQHPHAKTIVDTRVAFVVGQNAWTVEPCPKVASPRAGRIDTVQEAEGDVDPDAIGIVGDGVPPIGELPPPKKAPESAESKPLIDKALQRTLRTAWQKYTRRGVFHPLLGWKQFWREAYLRCERDGEVFIYLANHQEDGRLAPRFLEPEDIQHPLGINTMVSAVFDKDANGISVEAEDQSTVIGYYWLPKAILGAKPVFLPADRVIHHKINTDSGVRRGLSRLFVIRHFLRHFDTWIFQSLKHQKVQSMIAILRQWENAPESVIQNLVNSRKYRERTFTAPTGNSINYRTEEQYPTVDAPMGMKMTMCSPNGNFADSEILARRVLLAVAVGANLSEAMVTGDGSNASYASTRITQLIPLRHFEEEQGTWSETIEQFYQKWVQTESALGRIPKVLDDSMLDCNVTPNPLPDFEQELRAAPVTTLRQAGIIPLRTAHELLGLDPETQEERMRQETEQLDADTQALRNSMTGGNAAPEAPAAEDDNPVSGKTDAEPGQEQGQAFVKTIDRMRGLSGVAPLNGSSYQVPLR